MKFSFHKKIEMATHVRYSIYEWQNTFEKDPKRVAAECPRAERPNTAPEARPSR